MGEWVSDNRVVDSVCDVCFTRAHCLCPRDICVEDVVLIIYPRDIYV